MKLEGHVQVRAMRDLAGHSRPSCKDLLACRHGLQRMQVLPRLTSCLALQHSRPFRIRRARLEDADSIARINAEVCCPRLLLTCMGSAMCPHQ